MTQTSKEKQKRPLTEAERQRRMKLLVYPLMVLLFAGSMWLIFAPSSADKAKEDAGKGFNIEMPAADSTGIIADKRKAYEAAEMEQRQQQRNRDLQDLGSLFSSDNTSTAHAAIDDFGTGGQPSPQDNAQGSTSSVRSSLGAYRDLNTTLGGFYEREQPRQDTEKEELKVRLHELEERLNTQSSRSSAMDEQEALLEKSYRLAAKYMPAASGSAPFGKAVMGDTLQAAASAGVHKKAVVTPVKRVVRQVVSALGQPMTDEAFIAAHSQARNYGFQTAVGVQAAAEKNTIAATVYGNQTVSDGQAVRLRLSEPMAAGERILPKNALITGAVKIQGERLTIVIETLEYSGTLIPTALSVYDTDGQEGIFIPNSMERSAAKEIAANMGTASGSSMNISTDAGAQLAADMGKGLLQGTSQYFAKKVRAVKVHLKAGYRVLLFQKKD